MFKKNSKLEDLCEEKWLRDYFKYVTKTPSLRMEEEKELFKRYKKGDLEAKKKIIDSNLRNIANLIKPFIGNNIPTEDLIQEATTCLISLMDDYDINSKYSFFRSSYRDIRDSLVYLVYKKSRTFDNVPVLTGRAFITYSKREKELLKDYYDAPTDIELKKELKINDDYQLYQYKKRKDDIPFIDDIDKNEFVKMSLYQQPYEDLVENKVIIDQIFSKLEKLGIKQRNIDIVKLRIGYECDKSYTLEEIAEKYNVTRQNIHQIERNMYKLIKMIINNELAPSSDIVQNDNVEVIVPVELDNTIEEESNDESSNENKTLLEPKRYPNLNEERKKELHRIQVNLYDSLFPYMLNFTSDAIESFKENSSKPDLRLIESIYTENIYTPVVHKLTIEERTKARCKLYPALLEKAKEYHLEKGGLSRAEENEGMDRNEIIIRGLSDKNPCGKNLNNEELAYVFSTSIDDIEEKQTHIKMHVLRKRIMREISNN